MKFATLLIFFLTGCCVYAQQPTSNYRTKKMAVKDSIQIDTVSINSSQFSIKTKDQVIIDSSYYKIDFSKALLTFKKPIETDSVIIDYLRYPNFITRKYFLLDDKIIVDHTDNMQQLYKMQQSNLTRNFMPFDGLTP